MARKIDYDELCDKMSELMIKHMDKNDIPVPAEMAMDICFSIARLRQIELDLQGKFQEI